MTPDANQCARNAILGRLRERLGRHVPEQAYSGQVIEDDVRAHEPDPGAGLRPSMSRKPEDLLARFQEKARALASTVDIVTDASDVAAAVARYLETQNLPRQAVCWPELAALDWKAHGLSVEARAAQGEDRTGITGCFAAVAETGSLVLCSGIYTPAVTSLLPETHIAILDARRLVSDMEDIWALLRAEQKILPRAVNFVSGPSRTGDIEQTIVLGAHGPYRVHVIVIDRT